MLRWVSVGLLLICATLLALASVGEARVDTKNNQSTPFRIRTPDRVIVTEGALRPIMSLEPRRPEFSPAREGIVTVFVVLDEPPTLSRLHGRELAVQALQIRNQQNDLIEILTSEPYNAVLVGRITLSANALIVTVDASHLESIQQLPGVSRIEMDRPMRLGE